MFETRRVDHQHAPAGRGDDVDVVQPDARARDHLQLRRGGQRLGVDLGGAAHDDRVDVGERRQQRRPVRAVDVADLGVLGQHGERGRRKLFGDEHDGSWARRPAY